MPYSRENGVAPVDNIMVVWYPHKAMGLCLTNLCNLLSTFFKCFWYFYWLLSWLCLFVVCI